MIRISTRTGSDGRVRVCVEGGLRAANLQLLIDALRSAASAAAEGQAVVLDLSGVSYVDAAGARFLREARDSGTTLDGCSGLVAELLRT